MKTHRLLLLFLFTFSLLHGQSHLIVPQKRVESIPITINQSTIDDVTTLYGQPSKSVSYSFQTGYEYDSLGLIFYFLSFDSLRKIIGIGMKAPFEAHTLEGIKLGKSTMKKALKKHHSYITYTNKHYVYSFSNGWDKTKFFINKNSSTTEYNLEEKIMRIEIYADEIYKFPPTMGFDFNENPMLAKMERLEELLNTQPLDLEDIRDFLIDERENYPLNSDAWPYLNRTLNLEVKQLYIEFKIGFSNYKFVACTYKDKLFFTQLIQNNYNKPITILLERKYDQLLRELLTIRQLTGYTNQSFNLEENYKALNTIQLFGVACGIMGGQPRQCRKMINLINKKDYDGLSKWLHSLSIDLAIYGYFGLYILEKEGIEIEEKDKQLMNRMKNWDVPIYYCLGCPRGITPMSERLEEKTLNPWYNLLKNIDFLHAFPTKEKRTKRKKRKSKK